MMTNNPQPAAQQPLVEATQPAPEATTTTAPNLTQRVASAAVWNTLLFPVQFVVGLLSGVLTLNYLLPDQYGVLVLITGLAATIGLYADLGIERSLPRFLPEVEQRSGRRGVARFLRRVIGVKLVLVLLYTAGLQAMSGPLVQYVVANEQAATVQAGEQLAALRAQNAAERDIQRAERAYFGKQAAVAELQQNGRLFLWAVAALVLFGAIYDVFMAFLTAYFKQRAWNIITAGVALLQPLLIISFITLGWGLSGVLLGMVITPVVAVALALWQTWRAAAELGHSADSGTPKGQDSQLARRFLRFAGISFLTQLTNWFYDVAFVTLVFTALGVTLESVAVLAFAYSTVAKSFLSYAYLPFGGLLTPLLARVRAQEKPGGLQEAYSSVTRMFALVLIPAGIGLMAVLPLLLALLYPRYTDAITLAYILIVFCFAESLLSVPHNVLMVYERYRPVIVARVLAMISVPLLLLTVWLAPDNNALLLGAALAVGVARLLPRLTTLVAARRDLGLRFPLRFVLRVLAASLMFALPLAVVQWWLPALVSTAGGRIASALILGALALFGAVVYILALRATGGLELADRARILSLKLPFKRHLAKLL